MSAIRPAVRLVNRFLRLVLPPQFHRRLVVATKSALGYGSGQLPNAENAGPSTPAAAAEAGPKSDDLKESLPSKISEATEVSPESVERDTLAQPIGSIIGCGGARMSAAAYLDGSSQPERHEAKLVLCCAFSGRHRIIEKIVTESLLANHGKDVRWMLVGSSAEDLELIEALSRTTRRVAGLVVQNRPLGRKWQTCFYLAWRYYSADLYAICGSDDFVSSRLVDHVISKHSANVANSQDTAFMPSMYGTLEWLVCDVSPGSNAPQIFKCNYEYKTAFEPLGAGRFYTRQFVEECGGLIFESNKERLLDDRGYFEIRDRGYSLEYYTLEEGPLVSVKGGWSQMNKIEDIIGAPTLSVQEFSFAGAKLLANSLTSDSFAYIFKPGWLRPQFAFPNLETGLA